MVFEQANVIDSPNLPATLLVVSQNDVPAIREPAPELIKQLKSAGVNYRFVWVPGFPHFYPTGAVSLADDGTRTSVGERITDFLDENLK